MPIDDKPEMSDGPGSKKQRIKIISGGRALSPTAVSRQGSPAPGARGATPAGGDGTLFSDYYCLCVLVLTGVAFITDEEIRSLLSSNPGGVTVKFIADKFKARVKNDEVKKKLVASIKRLTVTSDRKTYRLKEDA